MKMPGELAQGYQRFRKERYRIEAERYRSVAAGQTPATMIIACADSRVDPATILSAAPGELFVVRNVGALVPPYETGGTYHGTSAAVEFAVSGLAVSRIVVMGHGLCGGIAASLAAAGRRPVGHFIGPWVDLISDVRDQFLAGACGLSPAEQQHRLERLAILHSLGNLATFPFVRTAIDAGRLELHGAWFSIAEGALYWLDRGTGKFEHVPA